MKKTKKNKNLNKAENKQQKTAVIIGAGPAGLTAAYELVKHTDIKPLVFEASNDIGGISKTVNFKGNRIDIGGHRFFSKSDTVMKWWNEILQSKTHQNLVHLNLNIVDKKVNLSVVRVLIQTKQTMLC